jgi:hypothetical protein
VCCLQGGPCKWLSGEAIQAWIEKKKASEKQTKEK